MRSRGPVHAGGRPNGFTLIELLVVVAIIALLLAILYPVLRHARAASQRTACMGNLHHIGLGCMAYASDHNGWFPGAQLLGGKPVGKGAYRAAWFRPAPGHRIPNHPDAIPETYGLAAVFDRLKILPGRYDLWICPAAAPLIQSFKNTYAFDGSSQSDGAGRNDRKLYNVPACRTKTYVKDFYYDAKPMPTGLRWSDWDMGTPENQVPEDQWLAPHRLNSMTTDRRDVASGSYGVNGFFYDGHVALRAIAG